MHDCRFFNPNIRNYVAIQSHVQLLAVEYLSSIRETGCLPYYTHSKGVSVVTVIIFPVIKLPKKATDSRKVIATVFFGKSAITARYF